MVSGISVYQSFDSLQKRVGQTDEREVLWRRILPFTQLLYENMSGATPYTQDYTEGETGLSDSAKAFDPLSFTAGQGVYSIRS